MSTVSGVPGNTYNPYASKVNPKDKADQETQIKLDLDPNSGIIINDVGVRLAGTILIKEQAQKAILAFYENEELTGVEDYQKGETLEIGGEKYKIIDIAAAYIKLKGKTPTRKPQVAASKKEDNEPNFKLDPYLREIVANELENEENVKVNVGGREHLFYKQFNDDGSEYFTEQFKFTDMSSEKVFITTVDYNSIEDLVADKPAPGSGYTAEPDEAGINYIEQRSEDAKPI